MTDVATFETDGYVVEIRCDMDAVFATLAKGRRFAGLLRRADRHGFAEGTRAGGIRFRITSRRQEDKR